MNGFKMLRGWHSKTYLEQVRYLLFKRGVFSYFACKKKITHFCHSIQIGSLKTYKIKAPPCTFHSKHDSNFNKIDFYKVLIAIVGNMWMKWILQRVIDQFMSYKSVMVYSLSCDLFKLFSSQAEVQREPRLLNTLLCQVMCFVENSFCHMSS